jgi:hypothetical protein
MRSRAGQKPHYVPQVHFRDVSGTLREFTSTTSANPAKWPVGTRIAVVFASENPNKAEIAVPLLFWRGSVGVLVLGLGLLLSAVL